MSTVAIPPTKNAGRRRPPRPPIGCGFGGFEEKPDQPFHKVLAESVRLLMKALKAADPERLPVLKKLIAQRKRLIEDELHFQRMMAPEPLPPLIADLYSLEFLGQEEEPVSLYLRLLSTLDDADAKLDQRLRELNSAPPASDL